MDIQTQDTILIIASTCSVLACLTLLWTSHRRNNKPVSWKMIITLSIMDCAASLLFIIFVCFYTVTGFVTSHSVIKALAIGAADLSVMWSCNIARFVSKSITGNGISDPNEYFKRSLLFCCIIASIVACMEHIIEYLTNKIEMLIVVTLVGIVLTALYYLKAIRDLSCYQIQFQQSIKLAVRNLYFFAFAQILTFGPFSVAKVMQIMYPDMDLMNTLFVGMVLITLAGFVNASVYLFTSSKGLDLDEQSIIEGRPSQNNSLVEGKV